MEAVRRRWCRWLIVAILLVLGGCSAVRLGYDQAEPVLRWWADRQLDLNASQSRWLKDQLRQFHLWHRQTELPAYADLAGILSRQAAGDVSPAQVCENIDSAAARLDLLLRQAVPMLAGLHQLTSAEQRSRARDKLAAYERDFRQLAVHR